jgi:hypothetical protein
LGQEGDSDNEASRSENSSQETNQNSMCVSSEITSLSCNKLSSEINAASIPGEQGPEGPSDAQGATGPQGPAGPQSVAEKISSVVGPVSTGSNTISTATCNPGETAISGGHFLNFFGRDNINSLYSTGRGSPSWEVLLYGGDSYHVQAIACCFANP